MLTLYGSPGSRSTRVAWALEEASAEYDFILIDLKQGEQKNPEFLKLNPNGKLPVLVDGELVLSESGRYLHLYRRAFSRFRLGTAFGTIR